MMIAQFRAERGDLAGAAAMLDERIALGGKDGDGYCTRATFATTALMGGVNPSYIARQLGHKNAAVTHKHYARWIDGSDSRKEARKVNRLFGLEGTFAEKSTPRNDFGTDSA